MVLSAREWRIGKFWIWGLLIQRRDGAKIGGLILLIGNAWLGTCWFLAVEKRRSFLDADEGGRKEKQEWGCERADHWAMTLPKRGRLCCF